MVALACAIEPPNKAALLCVSVMSLLADRSFCFSISRISLGLSPDAGGMSIGDGADAACAGLAAFRDVFLAFSF